MPATLQFGFRSGATPRRQGADPARLLLLADFSGRGARGELDTAGLATRPTHAVDVDTLDKVLQRLAPRLPLGAGDAPSEIGFCALDDFHPDRLLQRHPGLQAQMQQRRRLLDPAQFAAAARELSPTAAPPPAQPSSPAPPAVDDDRALLGRLMGGAVPAPAPTAARPAAAIDALVRQALSARDLAPELPFQAQYVAAVDSVLAESLRRLLHDAQWQSLEAAWRGVHWLVSNLDLGESLQLHLMDITAAELQQGGHLLAQRFGSLAEAANDAGAHWAGVGLLAEFGGAAEDLAWLEILGLAAARLGAPLVATAQPGLAGISPQGEWQAPDEATMARWSALRNSAAAGWLGLAAPRLLLRLPHGPKRDPIDSFDFDELQGEAPQPAELLWGGAALAVLLMLGRLKTGADEAEALAIDDLPALSYTAESEKRLQPATEWVLGDRAAELVLMHGVMPLQGSRHRNAARLLGWRTLQAQR